MIRIPNDFFSVSFYTYMNGIHTCTHTYDIHILNPNETIKPPHESLFKIEAKSMDGWIFFLVYIFQDYFTQANTAISL